MIDIHFVRGSPDAVRESQRRRGNDEASVNALLATDEAHGSALQAFETARASQKEPLRSIGKASPEEHPAILAEVKALTEYVKELRATTNRTEQEYPQANTTIQNIVLEGTPAGGEEDYEVLRHIGGPRVLDSEPKDHLDIAEALNAIDVARGTKVPDSCFYYLKGVGARLELALLTMAADRAEAADFTMMTTPTLVNPDIIVGTGFLDAHSGKVYYLLADSQYLVDTSKMTLARYHKDEIVDLSNGPLHYTRQSSYYHRKADSYGKNTRRIVRVYQFNKVEMLSYHRPEETEKEHHRFLTWEEGMPAKVELPYRVVNTAAGGLDSSAAQKFDCGAWLPTQSRFMGVTSTSNCTTSQARRFGIRERFDGETRMMATLNGTLAIARWLVALFESHQRPNGSLYIPEALRPYLSGRKSFEPVAWRALKF